VYLEPSVPFQGLLIVTIANLVLSRVQVLMLAEYVHKARMPSLIPRSVLTVPQVPSLRKQQVNVHHVLLVPSLQPDRPHAPNVLLENTNLVQVSHNAMMYKQATLLERLVPPK
jgi:hypothetical protein